MRKFLCPLLMPLLCSSFARAELGGNVSHFPAEQARAQTALRVQSTADVGTTAAYQTHEQTTDAGITIREYTDPNGAVFAVTWDGPVKPDLKTLLGPYFQNLLDVPPQPGNGPVQVTTPELVIFSGGRPRAFFGRAFMRNAIPAGVTIDELR